MAKLDIKMAVSTDEIGMLVEALDVCVEQRKNEYNTMREANSHQRQAFSGRTHSMAILADELRVR